ncbi:MAG: hypothetical protein M9887_12240 [Chitinophagales bacterium]|nr:hypothetical protein [Chitinophagales bacterium]
MYKTYHLSSAQEVDNDILDAIKTAFQSRPITIIVHESDSSFELTDEMKNILDDRLMEDEDTYLTAEESVQKIDKKYGL